MTNDNVVPTKQTETKYMMPFATPMKNVDSYRVFHATNNSASLLHSSALDQKSGKYNSDFSQDYLIVAVFLYRHALELGIKILIKGITGNEPDLNYKDKHNIRKLIECLPNNQKIFAEEIMKRALNVLDKYYITKDEQLFRYPKHTNNIHALKGMPPIENPDIEDLIEAVGEIHGAIEQQFGFKKLFKTPPD